MKEDKNISEIDEDLALDEESSEQIDGYEILSNDLKVITKSNDELKNYIEYVSKIPILTKEQEDNLINNYIKNNDQKSAKLIILSHLRLVIKIAMNYKNYGMNLLELISEGNIGLMTALRKFDPSKKVRFATYAILWIKSFIRDQIAKSKAIIKFGSLSMRKNILFHSKKDTLSLLESNSFTKKEERDINDIMHYKELSIEENFANHNNKSLYDSIPSDNFNPEEELLHNEYENNKLSNLKKAIFSLNERERDIILLRYSNEKITLDELGLKFKISKERVRQIEKNALDKMKKYLETNLNK